MDTIELKIKMEKDLFNNPWSGGKPDEDAYRRTLVEYDILQVHLQEWLNDRGYESVEIDLVE